MPQQPYNHPNLRNYSIHGVSCLGLLINIKREQVFSIQMEVLHSSRVYLRFGQHAPILPCQDFAMDTPPATMNGDQGETQPSKFLTRSHWM